ncbi:MAG: hypothetical protein ACE5EY_11630, partial [Anaerolineae bacterium]
LLAMLVALAAYAALFLFTRSRWLAAGNGISHTADQIALLNFEGNADLYVWDARTNEMTQLTKGHRLVQAAWSPDGGQLLLVTNEGALTLLDPDTAVTTPVDTGQIQVRDAVWSPDGRQIAFTAGGSIYVINSDGTNLARLADGREPDWSPDGRSLLFITQTEGEDGRLFSEIGAAEVAGSGRQTRLSFPGEASQPAWSPDGRTIFFLQLVRDASGGVAGAELFLMDADGGNLRQLEPPARSETYPPINHTMPLSWSPDGREILLANNAGEIYRYALETDEFTYTARGDYPIWNPGGTAIVYQKLMGRNSVCLLTDLGEECADLSLNGAELIEWRP